MAATHSEGGYFTLRITLTDFLMIQRGLMLLPDDAAKETLGIVRAQMQKQVAN